MHLISFCIIIIHILRKFYYWIWIGFLCTKNNPKVGRRIFRFFCYIRINLYMCVYIYIYIYIYIYMTFFIVSCISIFIFIFWFIAFRILICSHCSLLHFSRESCETIVKKWKIMHDRSIKENHKKRLFRYWRYSKLHTDQWLMANQAIIIEY